jgi:hypothetical protein
MVTWIERESYFWGVFVKPDAKSNPVACPLGFLGHEIV